MSQLNKYNHNDNNYYLSALLKSTHLIQPTAPRTKSCYFPGFKQETWHKHQGSFPEDFMHSKLKQETLVLQFLDHKLY